MLQVALSTIRVVKSLINEFKFEEISCCDELHVWSINIRSFRWKHLPVVLKYDWRTQQRLIIN